MINIRKTSHIKNIFGLGGLILLLALAVFLTPKNSKLNNSYTTPLENMANSAGH